MQCIKFITTTFLCLSILQCLAQSFKFQGYIYGENGKILSGAIITLIDSNKSILTNENGYFSFTRSEDRDVLIAIQKDGFRTSRLYISTIEIKGKSHRFSLCRLCQYDSSTRVCPVCRKRDKTLEIIYGFPIPPLRKDRYYAGCEVTCCDPKYYCTRDEKSF